MTENKTVSFADTAEGGYTREQTREEYDRAEERLRRLRRRDAEAILDILATLRGKGYSVDEGLRILRAAESNIMRYAEVPDPVKLDLDGITPF